MTEAKWLASAQIKSMLEFLAGRASERKLRLFACACVRRVWDLLIDPNLRTAVETAELYADGLATENQRYAVKRAVQMIADHAVETAFPGDYREVYIAPCVADAALGCVYSYEARPPLAHLVQDFWITVYNVSLNSATAFTWAMGQGHWGESDEMTRIAEQLPQARLLRDIFGNPFHPLPPRPEAIAPLAEQIYAGAWDQMPLLGEWLQEHGYWSEGEHCLDPNNHHVKGCWVVDWVTGRE